jgi:hypothetical protein
MASWSARRSSSWSAHGADAAAPVRAYVAIAVAALATAPKEARMSWINRVRNASRSSPSARRPTISGTNARAVREMVFVKEYEENLYVCPTCGHHGRIGRHGASCISSTNGAIAVLPNPRSRTIR